MLLESMLTGFKYKCITHFPKYGDEISEKRFEKQQHTKYSHAYNREKNYINTLIIDFGKMSKEE